MRSAIIEIEAFETAQPCPSNPTSRITPDSTRTYIVYRSPQSGLYATSLLLNLGGTA